MDISVTTPQHRVEQFGKTAKLSMSGQMENTDGRV
jgi:ribonuclease HI